MLLKNISFEKFKVTTKNLKIKNKVEKLLDYHSKQKLIKTFTKTYKYSFDRNKIKKFKNYSNYRIIGMGGSSLGIQALYNFLNFKINKKFTFLNNLNANNFEQNDKKKTLNIIISKSGNTIETITNFNNLRNKKNNLFICENSNNYLRKLANKLKSEIIEHKNYVGGRYSVLSEVGMLPSILMGLDDRKFKNLDNIIKNKNFVDTLINSVSSTINFIKNKKKNSIILNYDYESEDLFKWYQQLIAESLGKNLKAFCQWYQLCQKIIIV